MSYEAIYTLIVVALLVICLLSNRVGTDTAMLGALTLLLVGGAVDLRSAISGFSDPSVLTIACLFVVATGLNETGAMTMIASRLLGRPKTLAGAQVRLMAPVAIMSALMNNTPIVAMYLPIVQDWSRRLRISPSRLFMPLSFAAIMGGACTLIGTSTNLAVNQLYVSYIEHLSLAADQLTESEQALAQSLAAMGVERPSTLKQFWWIAVVGVPSAIVGIAFIAIASRWLLPERITPDAEGTEERQYTVALVVEPASPIVGKSIEDAGLRQLPGLFLSEIERQSDVIPAVSPEAIIQAGDRLVFVGVVESVVDLMKIKGLVPATDQVEKIDAPRRERTIVEAVVSHTSPLVRKSVRQSQFRTRYNAAIIAVHRGGQRLGGKIGDINLQAGDTLLLSTHHGFIEAFRNSGDFYLVSGVQGVQNVRHERAWLALSILALLVALLTIPGKLIFGAINLIPSVNLPLRDIHPLIAALLCAMLMIYTRCTTGSQARRSINWQVLLVIAAALGIGRAMDQSGAARFIADIVFGSLDGLSNHALLFVFAILTSIFCQLVTNKAAAVLMFPIAMAIAGDADVNPEPYVVTLMVMAACSFMTPIGFVTNLMVAGPGGYRFSDYLRLGIPLTLIVATLATLIAPAAFPFHPQ